MGTADQGLTEPLCRAVVPYFPGHFTHRRQLPERLGIFSRMKDFTIFTDIELQHEQQIPTDYELAQQAIWDDEQQEMLDDYD